MERETNSEAPTSVSREREWSISAREVRRGHRPYRSACPTPAIRTTLDRINCDFGEQTDELIVETTRDTAILGEPNKTHESSSSLEALNHKPGQNCTVCHVE